MRGAHHCRSPICSWSLYSMKSSGARTRRQSSHVQLIADSMALADSAEARRCAVGGAASRRRYKDLQQLYTDIAMCVPRYLSGHSAFSSSVN